MNNNEFRRFVLDTPRNTQHGGPSGARREGDETSGGLQSLGSRNRSSIPMTPRTVKGGPVMDFARQLAEQAADSQPRKRFKASAAPKGVKLGAEYTDRARQRNVAVEVDQDRREERVKALEEQMKLGQIDQRTFEQLRDSITGGDIGATHLVKGLDRKLLERIRKGEDVLSEERINKESQEDETSKPVPDTDEEFEELGRKEIAPVHRDEALKKGELAPGGKSTAGMKRSRNDILAEWKASRKAAEESKASLGTRFKKFGASKEEVRTERDSKGREVLVTVDEYGKTKRKVRKLDRPDGQLNRDLKMPDKQAKPLGMEVPDREPQVATVQDDDIFEGVGIDYDPLGMENDEDEDELSSEDEANGSMAQNLDETKNPTATNDETSDASSDQVTDEDVDASHAKPETTLPPRKKTNYFSTGRDSEDEASNEESKRQRMGGLDDPAILETLKRAAALQQKQEAAASNSASAAGQGGEDRLSSAAQRLLQRDRDADDIDMGFGGSRIDDDEDDTVGNSRVKLSEWRGGVGDEDEGGDGDGRSGKGGGQRKRGKKKRKGDKNNAADVLRVMERQKQ